MRVAVVGASGYTGSELVRLLHGHSKVDVTAVYAGRSAGRQLEDVFPQFRGSASFTLDAFSPEKVAKNADVVFTALPHGASAKAVSSLMAQGLKVLDLSGDFRLDLNGYKEWYGGGKEHPNPKLLEQAVYGLVEMNREKIRRGQLVSCPGCYPTATTLPLLPLFNAGLVDEGAPVIVDAKSGVSGAGREPGLATHFAEAGEGVRAYKVAGLHRHTPEIEEVLTAAAGKGIAVSFTPHLLPMTRGILSCSYLVPKRGITEGKLKQVVSDFYRDAPFVEVLRDTLPDTSFVRGSNMAHVSVRLDERVNRIVAMGAIDNLIKGAAGQAVQCMNLICGFEETEGLPRIAPFP